jgi:hypothetical protein
MGRWRARFERDVPALPLDLFRILTGLLCCAYFASLLWQVPDFSSPHGLIEHALLQQIFWFTRLSLFHPGLGAGFFYGIFALACLGACGIVLGYRVKLCAGVLFAVAVSTYRWNFIVMYVDDAIMHLLLFWLLLLPVGHTLVLGEWRRQRRGCLARWCQVTVPGMTLHCFLANVCLVYLVAGLWKFESPLWHSGFAVYATLRLPIAYTPDLLGPQHLPLLRVLNYLALLTEPLLPVLLLQRRGHPLKWLGLCAQLGFHLGILVTLRIPFANLALMATAVLFFRDDIMHALRRPDSPPCMRRPHANWTSRVALVFVVVLTLAMMRRLPVVGEVHKPAYALLWLAGIAQDYQLFNWIDRKNFYTQHRVTLTRRDRTTQALDPTQFFSPSLRAVLLQSYLHDVRWIAIPRRYRPALKRSLLSRLAQRFCRRHPVAGQVSVWSTTQRIRPTNAALTQGRNRFLMTFVCAEEGAVLCRTMLDRHGTTNCRLPVEERPPSTEAYSRR